MGHCRVVHIENIIEISRTAAIVDREKVKAEDAHAQKLNILERLERVLEDLTTSMKNVISTHIFTITISTFETVATAYAKFFLKTLNHLQISTESIN